MTCDVIFVVASLEIVLIYMVCFSSVTHEMNLQKSSVSVEYNS